MTSATNFAYRLRNCAFLITSLLMLAACSDGVQENRAEPEASNSSSPQSASRYPVVSGDGIWQIIEPPSFPTDYNPPTEFAVATVDYIALQALLDTAPWETRRNPEVLESSVLLPLPDETFAEFHLQQTDIMEVELSNQFPDIETYRFDSVGARSTISGHLTKRGETLYLAANTLDGLLRIDPVMSNEGPVLVIYFDRNRSDGLNEFEHVSDEQIDSTAPPVARSGLDVLQRAAYTQSAWDELGMQFAARQLAAKEVTGDTLRTFRFLATTTGEFYQNNGNNDGAVLLSLVQRINAVNAVMEPEISVRLILDADSLDVMFDDPATDGITDGDTPCNLRDANPAIVSGAGIAEADYDVGFLFSTGSSGGCAWYVVCEDSANGFPAHAKARGAGHFGGTGSAMGTGLILHETGHQLGAKHTYSGAANGCNLANFDGDDGSIPSAYAPGSGSTIMSYFASCGADNVDTSTNDNGQYYHAMSFDQIIDNITNANGALCGGSINTGNNPPSVNAGVDYTIPRQTPFTLGGSGSDPDGDALTYTWEQIDLATTQRAIDTDDGIGPIIRSIIPDATPARTVPDIRDLLDNSNQPMNGIQKAGELVPQVDRSVNMRLTARDGRMGGGGVNSDDMVITVSGAPHFITSPDSGSIGAGCSIPISWNPGGGNAVNVDILGSTNGGLAANGIDESFPEVIALATPNDGEYVWDVPCMSSNQYRIKVQASDNIYFDVNDNNLSVINTPPVSVINPMSDGEVDDQCEYTVSFSGSVSDACGVSATDVEVLLEKKPPGDFTLGSPNLTIVQNGPTQVDVSGTVLVSDLMSSPATLAVGIKGTDNCGSSKVEFAEVNVVDNTPPTIDVAVSPDRLWPANHKLVPIQATVTVTDNCPGASFKLVSILSNEADNGTGDGNTNADIAGADFGTDDTEFELRAERAGHGNGRVYTVTYSAGDGANNSVEDSATVVVPHSNKP